MKKIFRMIVFSGVAIFLTSLWNKGFILPSGLIMFLKATIALAIVYYLIVPLSRLILLPLNVLTLGLMSFLIYLFILHLANISFSLFTIKDWVVPGLSFGGIIIKETKIGYFGNLILSSLSISSIINLLEHLI